MRDTHQDSVVLGNLGLVAVVHGHYEDAVGADNSDSAFADRGAGPPSVRSVGV